MALLVGLLQATRHPSAASGPVRTVADGDLAALALDALRQPSTTERFYFVMTDRFANGDPTNDRGGRAGDRLSTGFDPSDKGFYHGGDLVGLTSKLDYIKGLGTTAIWLTPSFVNLPVQGTGADASAGYHGYWVTDFTRIDPHLGTNDEMRALVAAAHSMGMKVFFDIITNHTADVIKTDGTRYVGKSEKPYVDASGRPFDDVDYIGRPFPELDATTAFPRVPYVPAEQASLKVPAWLNDPRVYHNRGDSTWAGESSTYGDFAGLDDLWTERQDVVDGMTEIYQAWVDMGIDGFRIDTVKHVNLEFWQQFSGRVLDHARKGGKADFFIFGEVYSPDAETMARYTTTGTLPATLDFLFQAKAAEFVRGGSASGMRDLLLADDRYTDADSNAAQLPIFLSNHDLGRVGFTLSGLAQGPELLERLKLAHSLMYTFRGNPVVYYGDEQGLIGSGGDQDARQDMFATQTPSYAAEPVAGAPAGSRDRFDTSHPLYQHIAALARLRDQNRALADGAMTFRAAEPGLLVYSRLLRGENTEYVVVASSSQRRSSTRVETFSPGVRLTPIFGGGSPVTVEADGRVEVGADPLSVRVYKADAPVPAPAAAPTLTLSAQGPAVSRGEAQLSARLGDGRPAQVTFAVRPAGTSDWRVLATDDAAPYALYADVSGYPPGTPLQFRAVAKDLSGKVVSADLTAQRE